MTCEERRKRAEYKVYVMMTLGDILDECERFGIPTRTPKGRQVSRSKLEEKLIDFYTKGDRYV
jgi:hypothetical protein